MSNLGNSVNDKLVTLRGRMSQRMRANSSASLANSGPSARVQEEDLKEIEEVEEVLFQEIDKFVDQKRNSGRLVMGGYKSATNDEKEAKDIRRRSLRKEFLAQKSPSAPKVVISQWESTPLLEVKSSETRVTGESIGLVRAPSPETEKESSEKERESQPSRNEICQTANRVSLTFTAGGLSPSSATGRQHTPLPTGAGAASPHSPRRGRSPARSPRGDQGQFGSISQRSPALSPGPRARAQTEIVGNRGRVSSRSPGPPGARAGRSPARSPGPPGERGRSPGGRGRSLSPQPPRPPRADKGDSSPPDPTRAPGSGRERSKSPQPPRPPRLGRVSVIGSRATMSELPSWAVVAEEEEREKAAAAAALEEEKKERETDAAKKEENGELKDMTMKYSTPLAEAERVFAAEKMMWSWVAKVGGLVMDKQGQESLEQILRLLNTLFRDVDQKRSVDAMLALAILAAYYNTGHVRSYMLEDDGERVTAITHYFKFSASAYGWKMLNPLMFSDKKGAVLLKGFSYGDSENNKALCEHTGIAPEDIIATKWTSSDYHPAHFIAVDHSTNAVVLSIRGTFHVKDAMADLVANPTKFMSGHVHSGMLVCARKKLEMIRNALYTALQRYADYKLVVVGHSLGAGTASLITLLIKQERPDIDMHCYAYAPPCVLSTELAFGCRDLITSIALGHDCVPRLSYGSISRLKNLTSKIISMKSTSVKRLFLTAVRSGKVSEKLSKDIDELKRELVDDIEDRLLPPGTIYHLVKEDMNDDTIAWVTKAAPNERAKDVVKKCWRLERTNVTLFSDIIICATMFNDHLPWNYHGAFEGVMYRHKLDEELIKKEEALRLARNPVTKNMRQNRVSMFRATKRLGDSSSDVATGFEKIDRQ